MQKYLTAFAAAAVMFAAHSADAARHSNDWQVSTPVKARPADQVQLASWLECFNTAVSQNYRNLPGPRWLQFIEVAGTFQVTSYVLGANCIGQ